MHPAADIQFWTSTPLEQAWKELPYARKEKISQELYKRLIAQIPSSDELYKELEVVTIEHVKAQVYLEYQIFKITFDIRCNNRLPNLEFGHFKNKLWDMYRTVDGVHFLTSKYTVEFLQETTKWFIERVLREAI